MGTNVATKPFPIEDIEITVKVRLKKGLDNTNTLEQLRRLVIVSFEVCERHGTVAAAGVLVPPADVEGSVSSECVLEQLRLLNNGIVMSLLEEFDPQQN